MNSPLVEFIDIDRDGMIDIVFYHNKQIYVFFNVHPCLEFTNSFD